MWGPNPAWSNHLVLNIPAVIAFVRPADQIIDPGLTSPTSVCHAGSENVVMKTIASADAKAHTAFIREAFQQMIQHLREDVEAVEDAKAQALFETAAEVMAGLDNAFKHYEEKSEEAWK